MGRCTASEKASAESIVGSLQEGDNLDFGGSLSLRSQHFIAAASGSLHYHHLLVCRIVCHMFDGCRDGKPFPSDHPMKGTHFRARFQIFKMNLGIQKVAVVRDLSGSTSTPTASKFLTGCSFVFQCPKSFLYAGKSGTPERSNFSLRPPVSRSFIPLSSSTTRSALWWSIWHS